MRSKGTLEKAAMAISVLSNIPFTVRQGVMSQFADAKLISGGNEK